MRDSGRVLRLVEVECWTFRQVALGCSSELAHVRQRRATLGPILGLGRCVHIHGLIAVRIHCLHGRAPHVGCRVQQGVAAKVDALVIDGGEHPGEEDAAASGDVPSCSDPEGRATTAVERSAHAMRIHRWAAHAACKDCGASHLPSFVVPRNAAACEVAFTRVTGGRGMQVGTGSVT